MTGYDGLAIAAITISFAAIVIASIAMERRMREIRIHKKIQADPILQSIKWPRWIISLAHLTIDHDSRGPSNGQGQDRREDL